MQPGPSNDLLTGSHGSSGLHSVQLGQCNYTGRPWSAFMATLSILWTAKEIFELFLASFILSFFSLMRIHEERKPNSDSVRPLKLRNSVSSCLDNAIAVCCQQKHLLNVLVDREMPHVCTMQACVCVRARMLHLSNFTIFFFWL